MSNHVNDTVSLLSRLNSSACGILSVVSDAAAVSPVLPKSSTSMSGFGPGGDDDDDDNKVGRESGSESSTFSSNLENKSESDEFLRGKISSHSNPNENIYSTHCPPDWDGVLCWPETSVGEIASLPCMENLYGIPYNTSGTVTRVCETGGLWNKTDYLSCKHLLTSYQNVTNDGNHLDVTVGVYFFGYCLSLTALICAAVIFIAFKELRCLRNTIHSHLIITYILADALWVISLISSIHAKNEKHSDRAACVTFILLHYFYLTNFFWMFVEDDPLLTRPKRSITDIHIYATGYDNERKRQARREKFMFGLNEEDRYDDTKLELDQYLYDPREKPEFTQWNSNTELNVAYLALIFSASNLFRFPHACYVNGGIIFFLMYVFLIIMFIQPLIFFEMLIGQFSYRGEWGFGRLHKYARGFPHALLFVNITFVTLNNALVGYAGLYAVGALYTSPGTCNSKWSSLASCIPYDKLESSKQLLIQKSKWLEANYREDQKLEFFNATLFLSTELFFRYYILNYKGKLYKEIFHWKVVVAFLVVLIMILPTAVQTYIVSGISRVWIYLACSLPILLSLVLLHQYVFRGGYHTPRYFSVFNWNRVLYLEFWTDAFEMAISTVGVGYGLLIRVSSRSSFRYSKILQSSWILSISVIAFCLLCAMVVYTELAIIGLISEAKQFTHIFAQGFGVTFVTLSGALLKTGPSWVFITVFFGMTVFNIWPQIIATQMSICYIQDILPVKNAVMSKVIAATVTIAWEVGLIAIYASQAEFSTMDSFDLFGGTVAAGAIVLSEMGIALLLLGFREFMTDIEIMLDRQLSFTFQIQMRYMVGPLIMFTMFLAGVQWFHSSPVLIDTPGTSIQTYFLGIFLNTFPIVIMLVFAYIEMRKLKKVSPMLENSKFLDKRNAVDLYWKNKPRWAERRGAVACQGKSRIGILNKDFIYSEGKEMHYTHTTLKQNLRRLFSEIRTKELWNRLFNQVLVKKRFKSLNQVANYVLRREETDKMSLEVTFLKHLIHQCSTSDLTAACSKKLDWKNKLSEQQNFLLDKLLRRVDYVSDDVGDSSEDEAKNEDNLLRRWSATIKRSTTVSRASSSSSGSTVYRRVVGKQEKTYDEIRLELTMRIKKHLGLPFENELYKFQALRKHRFHKETRATRAFDALPEEHFMTIKVTKVKQPPVVLTVHIIVVRSSDHFVLGRLPIPRPLIVRATDASLSSLPGEEETDKICQLVIQKMRNLLWQVDLSILKQPGRQMLLLPNINADVYTFLDPIRTCVVILESIETSRRFKNKFRWLQPPTRRQHRVEEIPPRPQPTFEVEELTVLELVQKSAENRRINRMWLEPPDITYHPHDSPDSGSLMSPRNNIALSSSSSSGSSTVEDFKPSDMPKLLDLKRIKEKQKIDMVDENTFKKLEKELRKTFKRKELSGASTDTFNLDSVRHLTSEDWKKRHRDNREDKKPVYILHSRQPGPMRHSVRILPNVPILSLQDEIVETDDLIMNNMSVQPVWSLGEEQIPPLRMSRHQSTNELLAAAPIRSTIRDFSNLRNEFEHFAYYSEGRTLIIEKKEQRIMIEMASSRDSYASPHNPTAVPTNLTLTRANALRLYLYVLVVQTFMAESIKLRTYVLLGWGIPILVVVLWIIVRWVTMELHGGGLPEEVSHPFPDFEPNLLSCPWLHENVYDWIYKFSALLVLAANMLFLLQIMWVLITKLRSATTPETQQSRKAAKALVVLMPLLGITYILVLIGPKKVTAYEHIRAFLLSTQGFLVALFYCFLNQEVRLALRHRWGRLRNLGPDCTCCGCETEQERRQNLHQMRDWSPRSRTESIRLYTPSGNNFRKRESSASETTTVTAVLGSLNGGGAHSIIMTTNITTAGRRFSQTPLHSCRSSNLTMNEDTAFI